MEVSNKGIKITDDEIANNMFPMWSAFELGVETGKKYGMVNGIILGALAASVVYWIGNVLF